jgi:hypothetical protein
MDPILANLADFATNLKFSSLPANAVTAGKERTRHMPNTFKTQEKRKANLSI